MRRKIVFDAVRRMLGRGFRPNEVVALDRALTAATRADESRCQDESRPSACPAVIGEAGTALIKRFEGCARRRSDGFYDAYPDPGTGAAPWTIGWGATGAGIEQGTVWSQEQCDARLTADLARYAAEVARALEEAATTPAQFDALVSFHYNTGAIGRATLTRLHREGDYEGAAKEFARWKRAGGRVLPGLVKRRDAEASLYRKGF
ncbi:lysozyme [Porphyrobacter sp. GA68]|uniref:lysozyme n=1 Tax=Porphyrobacter sp. GA68 TaxID=2883480 RepID=UPI001D1944F7|nr:lysozyme [Porphyrobacter sp. GA68]